MTRTCAQSAPASRARRARRAGTRAANGSKIPRQLCLAARCSARGIPSRRTRCVAATRPAAAAGARRLLWEVNNSIG